MVPPLNPLTLVRACFDYLDRCFDGLVVVVPLSVVRLCRTSTCFVLLAFLAAATPPPSFCAARFSPDDKFSKERVTLKKRFGLLPSQQPPLAC
jgi:hypothetical protein